MASSRVKHVQELRRVENYGRVFLSESESWTCGAKAGLKFWIQPGFGQFQVGFQVLKSFKFPKVRKPEIVTECYQGT